MIVVNDKINDKINDKKNDKINDIIKVFFEAKIVKKRYKSW